LGTIFARIFKICGMYKFILIGFVLFSVQLTASAQQVKITGKVTDSLTVSPLEYATITVFAKGEKKTLTGTTTDNSGHFELTGIKDGVYSFLVESIGYKPYTLNEVAVSKKNPVIDLKNIRLSKKRETLADVTVIAQKGLIENKIDKIVFNAEKDLTSQGGVATDILKKVPQVSVDVDGNVELAGSSSIRFLINGKPSTAFGSSIADVLQSIPASQIKSIEVITNPGAKYDAEGLGGIINIILKQNSARGINGNLSLTAGTRMENGSFNLNARNGNFGMNAFISGNYRLAADMPTSSDRLSSDTAGKTNSLFHQEGTSRFTRHGYQSGIGFDWTYKKKNNFTGSLGYDNFGFEGNGTINQSQITNAQGGGVVSDIVSTLRNDNVFSFHNLDASLNYKRKFDKEDQELEISGNTSFGNNHITGNSNQYLQPQDSLYYGTRSVNPGTTRETEVQIDYTQPFSKDVKLGLGGKLQLRDINSASTVLQYQPDSKAFFYDGSLSNNLNYHQKVYALYTEINFPVSSLFDARVGGRYERTELSAYFSNAQQQANNPGYNTFVPSIFFIKKLENGQTLKLSYSKRIQRPDYRDLNPFINTTDPKNISRGNPYLQPEIGNRFELSYSRDLAETGTFMVTAFYRINDHDIQPYIVYYTNFQVGDTSYSNVAVSTNQNIGMEKNLGLSIFNDLHFSKKLNIRTNLFFFQRHTINALDPGFNSNSFNYRLNMNISYQFSKDLAGEFFGNFNSARHEVQGKYPSFTSYSFAIRKQFWNKKGSLAFTAINPFNEYVNQRTAVFGPNFSVNGLRKVPFRSIGLNFTWKFGKLEFKKEKKDDNSGGNLNPPSE
jgi:ferric enterobactin receptor